MKRILLVAVMMVALFASPVAADAPVVVAVDNKALSQYGVMINGSVYVPLRAVCEAMGAKAEWVSFTRTAYIYSNADVVVEGDANFKSVIGQALELLRSNDPVGYEIVCDNAKRIGISDDTKSDIPAFAFCDQNSDVIYFTHNSLKSPRFVPQWIASVLVHEAVHCSQQGTSADAQYMANEKSAFSYQLATLTVLNAPQELIDAWSASIKAFNK